MIEAKGASILFALETDRKIKNNRPDIVVKKRKTCLLIHKSVPKDNKISVKIYYNISKYKNLEIEIEKAWYL